jgi:uncharacterized protein
MDRKYAQIRNHVLDVLGEDGSHGMDHVLRVTQMCGIIGLEESADMDILIPAALLHDIARPCEKETGIPHETEGARRAGLYLASIGYDSRRIPAITDAISTHRFRSAEKPRTLEAQILSDADKLDAMGAVGIGRTFMRAAEHGGSMEDAIRHFHEKLLHLHERMYTRTAQAMARERHDLLVLFLARLKDERNMSR